MRTTALLAVSGAFAGVAAQNKDVGLFNIPTEFQAAALTKQMAASAGVGNVMVKTKVKDMYNPGKELEGFEDFPYGQVELLSYDCSEENQDKGALLLFSSPLEMTTQVWMSSANNVTISIRQDEMCETDACKAGKENWQMRDPLFKHRATLMGSMEKLPSKEEDPKRYAAVAKCYFAKHPEAHMWEHMPSHKFQFFRFQPKLIHYVGGFGDSHYIGFIKPELYEDAPSTKKCVDWSQKGRHAKSIIDGKGNNKLACPSDDEAKLCCPVDDDNKFSSCCAKAPRSGEAGAGIDGDNGMGMQQAAQQEQLYI